MPLLFGRFNSRLESRFFPVIVISILSCSSGKSTELIAILLLNSLVHCIIEPLLVVISWFWNELTWSNKVFPNIEESPVPCNEPSTPKFLIPPTIHNNNEITIQIIIAEVCSSKKRFIYFYCASNLTSILGINFKYL